MVSGKESTFLGTESTFSGNESIFQEANLKKCAFLEARS